MAVRIQNLPKKNFGQANFSFSCPSWWTSNEQQQSLSKNISFKVESPTQLYHKANHLGLQLLDQESSSIRSIGQSHNEVGTGGEANSQDQCISSESGIYFWLDKFFFFALYYLFFPLWIHAVNKA